VNVARRELWQGHVWRIAPARLVERSDETLVLWHPPGIVALVPFAGERQMRIPGEGPWELREVRAVHEAVGVVLLGARWSTWVLRRNGAFESWYVNFERDVTLNGAFVDHVDEKLDLVIAADGTSRLKDEDELEEAGRAGYLDAADVRAQLARVLADPSWPTGWEEFEPDPAWPLPELPERWDVV
jgi:hypothetical protein